MTRKALIIPALILGLFVSAVYAGGKVLYLGDGTQTAPSLRFTAEPTSGIASLSTCVALCSDGGAWAFFRSGTNTEVMRLAHTQGTGASLMFLDPIVVVSVGGSTRMTVGTSVTAVVPFYSSDGTVAAPGYAFTNATGDGIASLSTAVCVTGANGVLAIWNSATDTGGALVVGDGSAAAPSVRIYASDGTLASPAYSFNVERDSGIASLTTAVAIVHKGGNVVFWHEDTSTEMLLIEHTQGAGTTMTGGTTGDDFAVSAPLSGSLLLQVGGSDRLTVSNNVTTPDNIELGCGDSTDALFGFQDGPATDLFTLALKTPFVMSVRASGTGSDDYGLGAQANPTIVMRSATAAASATDQWASLASLTTACKIGSGLGAWVLHDETNDVEALVITRGGTAVVLNNPEGNLHLRTLGVSRITLQSNRVSFGPSGTQTSPGITFDASNSQGIARLTTAVVICTDGGVAFWDATNDIHLLSVTGSAGATTVTGSSASSLTLSGGTGQGLVLQYGGATRITVGNTATTLSTATIQEDGFQAYQGSGFDVFTEGNLSLLVDNSATEVFSVVTGDGDMAGITISYTVESSDGTETQAEHGEILIAIIDDAGGADAAIAETSVQVISDASTLTTDWAVTTTDDQSLEITLDADTSLTPTTFQVRWHIISSGNVTITRP